MKNITFILMLLPLITFAQVSIPDANFETELIAQGIDTDGIVNGQISTADALAKTGTLNLNNKTISDLTGIEAFTNITQLRCEDNTISTLSISTLTNLIQLRCKNNNLSVLNVSSNTALKQLRFQNNTISTIDISNNTALTKVFAQNNMLSELITTANINLKRLDCQNNSITSLNITTNTALTGFRAQNNMLTVINVTNNTALTDLRVQTNDLTDLDVSNNSALIQLRCQGNNLATLNAKNGNNTAITTFNSSNNPSLTCIEVDDVAFADANFTKDATALFSTDCSTLSLENVSLKESIVIYPNPANKYINIKTTVNVDTVGLYDINGKLVLQSNLSKKIDIETLPVGVYFLKVKSSSNSIVKKIIKI